MIIRGPLLIVGLIGIVITIDGCSTCSDCEGFPGPALAPVASKNYDNSKRWPQITYIYFDHDSNGFVYRDTDEWVMIESTHAAYTRGWTLSAGKTSQRFPLPDSIIDVMVLFSHASTDSTMFVHSFNLGVPKGQWLWNKRPRDTAMLFNAQGALIDSLSFSP